MVIRAVFYMHVVIRILLVAYAVDLPSNYICSAIKLSWILLGG